jgi:hypothetical protein
MLSILTGGVKGWESSGVKNLHSASPSKAASRALSQERSVEKRLGFSGVVDENNMALVK